MANAVFFSNTAQQTTLSGSVSAGATTITVGATTGFPPSTPYVLALDYGAATEELVSVTGVAGTNLTVTRGYGGTSAQSHSLGAVVRHVYDATEATAFRTHEAATAAVHGVTGTLVGTSDTQTLANKTLTSPTVNGAALSGTLSGTPTFSGAVTLSGGAALAGTFTGTPTFSGAVVFSGTPSISNGAALSGTFTGSPTFSGGLTFTGGPTINTLSALFHRSNATDPAIRIRQDADSQSRLIVQADGTQVWGSGSATGDTNLYRSAADTLKTDDSLIVGAGLTVGSTTWTTYTPTVTGGGSVTWSTRTGYYYKLGKLVFVVAYLSVNAAGSGSSNVQVDMPSSVDRTTRQVLGISAEGVGLNGHSHAVFFTGGTGATSDRIRSYDGQNMIGSDLLAGGIVTVQGWYREA